MRASSLPFLLADHSRRAVRATRGFRYFGRRWLAPWLCYAAAPLLSRVCRGRTADFGLFRARLGRGDLYTFANLFEDYSGGGLRDALRSVEQVIDAGANVGAFTCLSAHLARGLGRSVRITAIEPEPENFAALAAQPFAKYARLIHGALGPADGRGTLQPGINSVTHSVAFNEATQEGALQVHSLGTLCDAPTLLKMDIEGGEFAILQRGLPPQVRAMFLEWHPGPDRPDDPRSVLAQGRWELLSHDLYGSSNWFWSAE